MRFGRGLWLIALGAALWLAAPSPAATAKYYMQIQGKEGTFNAQNAREGSRWSEIMAFSYSVETPRRDPHTGLPTGNKQHRPLIIRKKFDSASPRILRAVNTKEELKEVVIESVHQTAPGKEQVFQKITLRNAIIDKFQKIGKNEEEITLSFQEIQWTDEQGKTKATDDWLAPK